jgi:hypothetical protein
MFRREVKVPPNALFIVPISRLLGALVDGATSPAMITDCCAPGRLTRYTLDFAG